MFATCMGRYVILMWLHLHGKGIKFSKQSENINLCLGNMDSICLKKSHMSIKQYK